MKQALFVYAIVLAAMHGSYVIQGYLGTAEVVYGALTIMAAMISATFLWLWAMKMSQLSLGMAISWAGAGLVMAWWWLFTMLDRPTWMTRNELLLVILSLFLTGAVVHFKVLETTFGFRKGAFLLPVAGALALSSLLLLLVG